MWLSIRSQGTQLMVAAMQLVDIDWDQQQIQFMQILPWKLSVIAQV
jgi:hypothetical protein